MKIIGIVLLLLSQLSFAQVKKAEPYNHGHNGIELVSRCKKGNTVIVSTYNAKMTIREEIAQSIFKMYEANQLENNQWLTVTCNEAKVYGKCNIRTKNKLTAIDFYFEKVYWNSGTTEVYVKPAKP